MANSEEEIKVWDGWGKEITDEIEGWSTWEKVKAVKGFPGGLIAFLQTSTDSQGCGFIQPTTVQSLSWPVLQSGKDLIGVAKTGSGKTLAFLLPGFIKLRKLKKAGEIDTAKGPGLLTVTPTRELCHQIFSDAEKFGKPVQITAACCYGGANKREQEWKIKEGPDCLIATPGRLNDFCDSWVVDLSQVRFAILDEADRMLDMGFEPQIKSILDRVPWQRQVAMFTATWSHEFKELAKKYAQDPVHIQIGSDEITTNGNITQHIEVCEDAKEKKEALKKILKNLSPGGNCLVFSNTKKNCSNLAWELNEDKDLGLWTKELHGDLDQSKRDDALSAFRDGKARVLCATDIAARGLDIRNITVVVNFDCPKNSEEYVHRIGRTGRAEDRGEAYTFLSTWGSDKEATFIKQIMEKANQEVPEILENLAAGKSVQSTVKGGGGGGGDDWGSSSKDDGWGKKDEWWKKDDEKAGGSGGGGDDEWWKKDKDEGAAKEADKTDEWWNKEETTSDWKKKDDWKNDDWKKDDWKEDGEAQAEEEEDHGSKRDSGDLWGLLDNGKSKKARVSEEDAEAELDAAFLE
mmetsp:Transcript_11230/g.24742  ORF Transcript_11230/g.24742 Transcript_11230/m.24742 type:complete len:575 (+) Transcript_11230:154-1878(+)|eukprot:CAMPEP_0206455266 /NCGR_PEP_ID=MMETSP0324_2-20121206/21650_1 /ASSEMBLY_ACC=CAM_ASM_000836 /TAXON_ID=2866 /ORGANISM="Crypthecodinium cohnii, Strain Seligo" /LENGTH=574 /DNA_ID=CAMNT_0053925937 /DNA_START=127 /DNA_END=1851 /DNA_ORIENTATION=+